MDSHYDGARDTVSPNKTSAVPSYLKSLKIYQKIEFTEICMKDSRDLKMSDLKKLLKFIESSPFKKLIVSHGTYTMPDTAKYLKANLKRHDQTIVFTASLIPLMGFTPSDAPFNLGYSLAKVQELPTGIYVCMNGKIFEPEEVFKMLYEGRFVSIFGEKWKKKTL